MNKIGIYDFGRAYEKVPFKYFLADRNINIHGYYYIYWLIRTNDRVDNDILAELFIFNPHQFKVDKFNPQKPFYSFIKDKEWAYKFTRLTTLEERIKLISKFNISFNYPFPEDPIFKTICSPYEFKTWCYYQNQIRILVLGG